VEDIKFLSNRLFVWMTPQGFEETVVVIPNPQRTIPFTSKIPSKIPRNSNTTTPQQQRFPQTKLKLDTKSLYFAKDLVFLKFIPISKEQKVPLFAGWGDLITDIDIVAYPGGGTHKVMRTYESSFDLVTHKVPLHGDYHIESSDKTFFAKINVPPMEWPEHSWETGGTCVGHFT